MVSFIHFQSEVLGASRWCLDANGVMFQEWVIPDFNLVSMLGRSSRL